MSSDEWISLTGKLSSILGKYLPESAFYVEGYSEDVKFQARFETYISLT